MSVTPMMQQYHDARQAVGDALLLFRMGDFYELFFEDAKTAARVLGLALTTRDKNAAKTGGEPVPMAGFPHHQLDGYLAKIIAAGYRAAICEQVEDPREAKGLVRREVTRVVSRGTVTDDALLDPLASNYLVSIAVGRRPDKSAQSPEAGLAWIDLSTGQFFATTCPVPRLADQIARLEPSECLLADDADLLLTEASSPMVITRRPPWNFGHQTAAAALARHFGTQSLAGFGFDEELPHDQLAVGAAGAVLEYLKETQKSSLGHIDRLVRWSADHALQIDPATRRSLEITQTLRAGRREGSLLGVIDRTTTSMGARKLADWLAAPLTDVSRINSRLDAVQELASAASGTRELREILQSIYDVERLLARVTTGRASPRDLSYLGRTLATLPKIKARLAGRQSDRLCQLEERLDLCPEVRAALEAALVDDCPLTSREGGFIRPGYRAELDELRSLSAGGKQWMAQYQASQIERTGIPSLKVGFNKVFGYYLEVTHAHRDKVPDDFTRKQTLKNAERYITPELKEYEEKVLSADERAKDLEYELFVELREMVSGVAGRLRNTADTLAEIDVLAALAELARSRSYVRPEVVDEPVLDVEQGRHPVLDITEPEGTFVPNDVCCAALEPASQAACRRQVAEPGADSNGHRPHSAILLITGPNMAGKSTYIRQAALLTLLAQIGSFVPARRARIGVADRIFARVGASDELSRGQSTFMVEMTETARILNTATHRSLVILDEIGRGTSTYDGLSLAWSIVEHLHNHVGCRTLFATHYHELTDLEEQLPGVRNYNVAVKEWEDQVAFLHQVIPGAADKSYGIHVAQLAGVPRSVNERAREVLAWLERQHHSGNGAQARPAAAPPASNGHAPHQQLTLFEVAEHPLLDEIRAAKLEEITPLEALQLIARWQEQLGHAPHAQKPSRQDAKL